MAITNDELGDQAVRLAVAMTRLRSRLREEARAGVTGLPISQLAMLKRLSRDGAATAASLAAAEHVSQQAVAQSLAMLKREGLVGSEPDPTDRRKSLITVTGAGRTLIDSILASRDAWLVRAIDAAIAVEDRADLDRAIELLERLAAAHLGPEFEIR